MGKVKYFICLLPRFYFILTTRRVGYEYLAPSLAYLVIGLINNLTLVQEEIRPYKNNNKNEFTKAVYASENYFNKFVFIIIFIIALNFLVVNTI